VPRDSEDRHEPVRLYDLNLVDEGFDEGLALDVGADLDDRADVISDLAEGGAGGHDRLVVDLFGEFGLAVAQLLVLGAQGGEPGGEGLLVEGASLERAEVAVDGLLGLGEFGFDGGEFAGAVGVGVAVAASCCGDEVDPVVQDPEDLVAGTGAARGGAVAAAIAATYAAHGHALCGDRTACLRLYDRAHDVLGRTDTDTDPWGQFFSPAYIDVQRAHSLATLGDYPAAAAGFRTAIDGLAPTFHRDRGVYLAREALAHAGARMPEQAATLGLRALPIGAHTNSKRIMNSLWALHDVVAEWQTVSQVREFRHAMDLVPRPPSDS
jgi:hypothetical protein